MSNYTVEFTVAECADIHSVLCQPAASVHSAAEMVHMGYGATIALGANGSTVAHYRVTEFPATAASEWHYVTAAGDPDSGIRISTGWGGNE